MNFHYSSQRLLYRVLDSSHAQDVLNFVSDNRKLFSRYEADKEEKYYTLAYQKANLRAEYKAFLSGEYMRYYVYLKSDPDRIIGTVSFSYFRPFPYLTTIIGYKFDGEYHHQGYATEAVFTLCRALFHDHNTHRIEAFVLTSNKESCHVLERVGFTFEGIARKSIHLAGCFQDHYQYSLTNED